MRRQIRVDEDDSLVPAVDDQIVKCGWLDDDRSGWGSGNVGTKKCCEEIRGNCHPNVMPVARQTLSYAGCSNAGGRDRHAEAGGDIVRNDENAHG